MPSRRLVFTQTAYLINLHYTHGPGSWTLQEKEGVKWTGARAATAGPCCSCQRDSFRSWQTAGPDKLLALTDDDPGAHGNGTGANEAMNGGKQTVEAN